MKKIMALFLTIIISISLMTSCKNFAPTPTTDEQEITEETSKEPDEVVPRKQNKELKPWEDTAAQTASSISDVKDTTLGGKFTTDFIMTYMQFMCPSWSDDKGSITFTLYKWDTDYDKTVTGTPIATETFVDYADNATLLMKVEDASAGDYLFVASNGTGGVGMWSDNAVTEGYICYKNGKVVQLSHKILVDGYVMVE